MCNPWLLLWEELRPEDVLVIDLDGNLIEGEWPVPLGIPLHLELHRRRHDVVVAVHSHPRFATVWADLGRIPGCYDQSSALGGGELVVVDEYDGPVNAPDSAARAVASMGSADTALLVNHGVFVTAGSIRAAHQRAVALEYRSWRAWHVEVTGIRTRTAGTGPVLLPVLGRRRVHRLLRGHGPPRDPARPHAARFEPLTDHAPEGGGPETGSAGHRPAGRWPVRPLLAPAAALVGWALFTWYLFAQALAGPVIIWNDSKAYALVASKPLWSRAFWVGQRPPLTPLLIKVFGTGSTLLAAQAAIAAVAWGILALVVGRLVARGWRRVVAVWVILAFATALPVTLWNRSMLSESLAISLLALVFACFIAISRRLTWPRVAATAAVCLAFAASRDAQVWTVALLGLAVAVDALLIVYRDRRLPTRAAVLAGCLFLIVATTEWGTLSSHRTRQDVADVLFVRVFPYPGRVAWFAAHGMPEQRQIDKLAAATPTQPGEAKAVFYAPGDAAFAPLQHWVTTKGTGCASGGWSPIPST